MRRSAVSFGFPSVFALYCLLISFVQPTDTQKSISRTLTVGLLQVRPGEPVYAQVNRDKKRVRGGEGGAGEFPGQTGEVWQQGDHAPRPPQGGDSWV